MEEILKAFLDLVQQNPDLPVIPLVDTDVVYSDEYNSWIGSITSSEIKEFTMYESSHSNGASMVFRDEKKRIAEDLMDRYPDISEQDAMERADNMEWNEAIILNIGLP